MPAPYLVLVLLFSICLSCASVLAPWYENWSGAKNQTGSALDAFIGDSRKLFANHVFAKADAYFHSGYYPTIFDSQKREEKSHLSGGHESEEGEAHHEHDEHCEHEEKNEGGFLGQPKDWIDRFSRNFFPSSHSHLEKKGEEREILPWLRLSAELDPNRVDTYTIASYWLRSRLKKVKEAEQFLREGLRANPNSYEIYFELGRIYDEDHHDPKMARNLWEIALRKWNAQFEKSQVENSGVGKPTELVYEGITARLAKVEESEGNLKQAIIYLELLKEKSPVPQEIQKQIDELRQKLNSNPQK